jgi:16S rRNA (adenine1518-N6/adenine1519-N6)-dimethyltransferase
VENLRPLKRYGQNFLVNKDIADKIITLLSPAKHDIIIEIGAGKGALTELLLQYNFKQLFAVEIDRRLVSQLKKLESKNPKYVIVAQDFMDISIPDLIGLHSTLKVIGNIPYYLTSNILFRLFDTYQSISRAVLMVQNEVADRIVAEPGCKDYGILAIMCALHGTAQKEFVVKKENFSPVPKVDSAIISISFAEDIPDLTDYILFKRIIKGVFQMRRKKIHNSLKHILGDSKTAQITSIDKSKRPEALSISEYIALTNEVKQLYEA